MEEQVLQRLIDTQNRSVRVLEEIAQLIARLDKRSASQTTQPTQVAAETSFTSVNIPSQITISNVPLPVNIENQPIDVEQSGTWTVNVGGQPIAVSQSGSWSVTVTNSPLTVQYDTANFSTINATAGGDTTIVPAVSGKRIRVIAYTVVASASVNIKFRSGTTDITGTMRVVEGGGIAHAFDAGLFQTNVGQPLVINLSTNATVGGYVVYREV